SQVLGNLLNNAIRHTPPEGEIVVTTGQRGACATLCVRDSGEGIATPDLESLFTPFAQAPQGLARTAGGLGLGLAIVRGLVKLHGGAVEIESEGLGKGTAVTVTLPLDASIEASTQVSSPTPSPPRAGDVPPQRILIVEDNEDAAMTLQAALVQQGHVVHTAATAKAALDLARTRRLDTVICDIGLPDVDGYALAGELRETLGPSAALYALTGYAAPEDVERALDAGFDRHLKKPPRMSELSALLAAHARRADA
ncbi:MAG: ATP-binding protein, partial [Myxococcota bacterium]